MEIHKILKKLLDETQGNYLITESQADDGPSSVPTVRPGPGPGPRPRPPPPYPPDCSTWYIWAAVIVIILATVVVMVILIYFCRRGRERSGSLDAIITNIELQNRQESSELGSVIIPAVVPNLKNQQVIQNGDRPTRITIIERY